jgi:hydrogenase maturation protease
MNSFSSSSQTDGLLVIGYGNPLRGDDGVGPRVAEAMAVMNFPGVRTITCTLLTPELADAISQARIAVFVDAAIDKPNGVQLRRLEPHDSSQIMAHAADPRTMLALARDVFGHSPQSWWLTIPASKLDFSHELSAETSRGFLEALQKLLTLCRTLQMS